MDYSTTKTVVVGMAWTSVGTFLSKTLGLVNLFVILNALSVREYGMVELVVSIPPLLSIFLAPGLGQVVTAELAHAQATKDNARIKGILFEYLRFVGIVSFIPWGVMFIGAPLFLTTYDPAVVRMIQVASFLNFLTPFASVIMITLRAFLKFGSGVLYQATYESVKLVSVVSLFYFFDPSPLAVIIAILICEIVALGTVLPIFVGIYRSLRTVARAPSSLWSILIRHGKWGILGAYIQTFSTSIQPWLIKVTLGTEAVGIFATAYGLVQHTISLLPLAPTLLVILPRFADDADKLGIMVGKALKYQFIMSLGLIVIAFTVFPAVIGFLFPKYLASISLYLLMLPVVLMTALGGVCIVVHFAKKAQRSLALLYAFRALVLVGVFPIFTLTYGLNGASYALVAVSAVYFGAQVLYMRKLLPTGLPSCSALIRYDDYDRALLHKFRTYFRSCSVPEHPRP